MATYFIDGRLTNDAEMKASRDGNEFMTFSIAWNYGKDKKVHYYACTMRGSERTTKLLPYMRRGKYLVIVGEPYWSEYNGKTYEYIQVEKLNFAGGEADSKPVNRNPENKPYECDGKYFDTREEVDEYKRSKGENGPESFEDDMLDIPFDF